MTGIVLLECQQKGASENPQRKYSNGLFKDPNSFSNMSEDHIRNLSDFTLESLAPQSGADSEHPGLVESRHRGQGLCISGGDQTAQQCCTLAR